MDRRVGRGAHFRKIRGQAGYPCAQAHGHQGWVGGNLPQEIFVF